MNNDELRDSFHDIEVYIIASTMILGGLILLVSLVALAIHIFS